MSEPVLEIPIDQNWSLITDQVMGGVSSGSMISTMYQGLHCVKLAGQVSTENNGGFIQIGCNLTKVSCFNPSLYRMIRLIVAGNAQSYNIHLRTTELNRPWQSYRYTFLTNPDWQDITINFDQFSAYRTDQVFNARHLMRLGLVAIGREFDAELYLHSIQLLP